MAFRDLFNFFIAYDSHGILFLAWLLILLGLKGLLFLIFMFLWVIIAFIFIRKNIK